MYRKICIILAIIIFAQSSSLIAQLTIWEENFDSDPGNWTLENNWNIAESALTLSWIPQTPNYDLSATSPLITLPESIENLVVNQYISEYYANDGEVAQIEIIHSGITDTLWEFPLVGNNWGVEGGEEKILPLGQFTGEEVQFKFRSYGSSTINFLNWFVYEVSLTGFLDHDLAAVAIEGTSSLYLGGDGTWNVAVQNCGLYPEHNFTVKLMKEPDILIESILVSGSIEPGEQLSYEFVWTPNFDEVANVYGEVVCEGDEFVTNNITPIFNVNIYPENPIHVFLWDNDNNSDIEEVGTEIYLENALIANNVLIDTSRFLPTDLSPYDAVFVALGIFCVG